MTRLVCPVLALICCRICDNDAIGASADLLQVAKRLLTEKSGHFMDLQQNEVI